MTRPFTRLTVLFAIVCLLFLTTPMPAVGSGNGIGTAKKTGGIQINGGSHHESDDDDDHDDGDDDDDHNSNTNCDCCKTLPATVTTLQNTVNTLKTEVATLKTKVAQLSTGSGSGCFDISSSIAKTWSVSNPATGTTGAVTFFSNGTYSIVNGTYNAGGSSAGKSTGTYKVLAGGAIAFTYTGSTTVNRIAVVQCAEPNRIIHFVMGSTLDYEVLTTATPE